MPADPANSRPSWSARHGHLEDRALGAGITALSATSAVVYGISGPAARRCATAGTVEIGCRHHATLAAFAVSLDRPARTPG